MIKIHSNSGRYYGFVEDNVFYKKVKSSVHFLKVPPAIAFDIECVEKLTEPSVEFVSVEDEDFQRLYVSSMVNLKAKGFEFNRGYGDQIGLLLTNWIVKNKNEGEVDNSREKDDCECSDTYVRERII